MSTFRGEADIALCGAYVCYRAIVVSVLVAASRGPSRVSEEEIENFFKIVTELFAIDPRD
jgi:hypothetical protein